MEWIKITEGDVNTLPPEFTIVLGYSPKWVDEDFEPEGIRECFYSNDEWQSAKWCNDQDTWWNDDETKPTHWMQRPTPPGKPSVGKEDEQEKLWEEIDEIKEDESPYMALKYIKQKFTLIKK